MIAGGDFQHLEEPFRRLLGSVGACLSHRSPLTPRRRLAADMALSLLTELQRSVLRPLSQGGGRCGLTLGYNHASRTGTTPAASRKNFGSAKNARIGVPSKISDLNLKFEMQTFAAFAGFRLANFAFSTEINKRKERKGDAKFAKEEGRHGCTDLVALNFEF